MLFAGTLPAVRIFNLRLSALNAEEQAAIRRDVYLLSVGYWNELHPIYRKFILELIAHDYQAYLDFLHAETPLSVLRFTPSHSRLLYIMLHTLERAPHKRHSSYNKLAFATLLAFNMNLQINTLGDYIRAPKATAEEVWELLEELLGKVDIWSD